MKVDWKYVSKTTGYLSLKAAYVHDVQESEKNKRRFGHAMRNKPEFLRLFNWVISRAKHYAQIQNVTIDVILNEWENKRNYWWLNYYGDSRQPKSHSGSMKSMGLNGIRKEYHGGRWQIGHHTEQENKNRVCEYIMREQKNHSTKTKPRWKSWRRK